MWFQGEPALVRWSLNKTLIIFKLRAVAEELIRTADLIDGKISDKIGFFAETGDKGSIWLEKDWLRLTTDLQFDHL